MTLSAKAVKITCLILDIDGVLTDGRVGYSAGDEIKFFHVRDGHGLKLAMRAGLKVGALSGRSAEANRKRAEELGFSFIYEDKKNKKEAFLELLKEQGLKPEECLYMGDDVVDIPVMRQVGLAVTVADAPEMMGDYCDIRTKLPGGGGAVRELVEWLLKEQGKWDELMKRYVS
jgi:3-deoxy-D-manno-octulosonate 8-phosphate phosphatase (KDO 8-P phosphatase)